MIDGNLFRINGNRLASNAVGVTFGGFGPGLRFQNFFMQDTNQ